MNGNPFYEPYWSDSLEHHGVLGMSWGKRNGPPYPLDRTKTGRVSKVQQDRKKRSAANNESFFKRHKKAIAIGATAVAAGLAIYGGYRLKDVKMHPLGQVIKSVSLNNSGVKMLKKKESVKDILERANPLRGKPEGTNNCVCCSMASSLRQLGYDAVAKASPGQKMLNSSGVIETCFSGAKVFDGSAIKFGKSEKDAKEMLIKLFGQNAQGIVGIQWKNRDAGHAFNWKISDGKVEFFDGQQGYSGDIVSKYFSLIKQDGSLMLAGLDEATPNIEELERYVLFKR